MNEEKEKEKKANGSMLLAKPMMCWSGLLGKDLTSRFEDIFAVYWVAWFFLIPEISQWKFILIFDEYNIRWNPFKKLSCWAQPKSEASGRTHNPCLTFKGMRVRCEVYSQDFSTLEAKTRLLQVWIQPELNRQFSAILGYIERLFPKNMSEWNTPTSETLRCTYWFQLRIS